MPIVNPNDFQPGTTAVSAQVDNGFNIIYNLLSGVSTDQDTILRFNHGSLPALRVDQLGSAAIAIFRANTIERFVFLLNGLLQGVRFESTEATLSPFIVASQAVVTNLNADKLDGKHATEWKTSWSMNWSIEDPSTFPVNSFNRAQKVLVPGSGWIATAAMITYALGSASGSFTIEIRKHPAGNQSSQTVLATLTVNPGTAGGQIEVDINPDHTFTFEDYVYPILSAASSPAQRDVSITLIGTQPLV